MRQCVVIALLMSFGIAATAQQTQPAPTREPEQPSGPPQTSTVPMKKSQLTPAAISPLHPCSLAKLNTTCKYVMDRNSPMAPTQIQMFSKQSLVVIVKDEKYFERYSLDPVSGQLAQYPDTAATIVQGMLPTIGKFVAEKEVVGLIEEMVKENKNPCNNDTITTDPAPGKSPDVLPSFKACFVQLSKQAQKIYSDLEPYTLPDAISASDTPEFKSLDAIDLKIEPFLKSELFVTSRITAVTGNAGLKANATDQPTIAELTASQKLIDTIASDLIAYRTRIADLRTYSNGHHPCRDFGKELKDEKADCVAVTSNKDDDEPYQNMVTRTVTYALNTYNLVSYSQEAAVDASKKKTLGGNIVLNFADEPNVGKSPALRWEASAGVFFSSLPIRSFSVVPVFDGTNVTDNKVAQTIVRPTVIPYAAGNYRLTNDLRWSKWKSNLYLTGAVGVNPNTVSADFAAGLSLSWRTFMVSPLWHYGHDTRLTGFSVGESLGAAFKSTLPTQTYWTSAFGIGIGIRIPPITGR
jgi:hypothetical protein